MNGNKMKNGLSQQIFQQPVKGELCKQDCHSSILFDLGGSYKLDGPFQEVQQTKDNGFIAYGSTYSQDHNSDILVEKLNSKGKILWQRRFGGKKNDHAYVLKQTADGGYVLAGVANGGDCECAEEGDLFIAKVDRQGKTVWSKTMGRKNAETSAQSIIETGDGGILVIAFAPGPENEDENEQEKVKENGNRSWVIKFSPKGEIVWSQKYKDWYQGLVKSSNGGNIYAYSTPYAGEFNADTSKLKVKLLKFDKDGTNPQELYFELEDIKSTNISLTPTEDGGFLMLGGMSAYGSKINDWEFVKLDKNLKVEWSQIIKPVLPSALGDIHQTADKGYIMSLTTGNGFHFWILKLNAMGNLEWIRMFGDGSEEMQIRSIEPTKDGGCFLQVRRYFNSIVLIKIDQHGNCIGPGCLL